jgi:UDP-N-acetylmuramyl tripeptide synthase
MPTLDKLLAGLTADLSVASGPANFSELDSAKLETAKINIAGITTDPELCKQNFLYVAEESETVDSTRYGVRLDGRHYINRAMENGATVVLSTPDTKLPKAAKRYSYITRFPYRFLDQSAQLSTASRNQKISHSSLAPMAKLPPSIFARCSGALPALRAARWATSVAYLTDGTLIWDRDPTLSVPETVTLHTMLNMLALRHINHVAFEATSHAIFDYRLHSVRRQHRGLHQSHSRPSRLSFDHG